MPHEVIEVPVQPVTRGPNVHFFGYYDKSPWDASCGRLLAMQSGFDGRSPTAADALTLGLVDPEADRAFAPFGQTRAWNWQQGCMLRWLPPACDRAVLYNDCVDGRHVGVVHDLSTGGRTELPMAVYDISRDGRAGAGLNFARITTTRPGYGYEGAADPFADQPVPSHDGLWVMDMAERLPRLVLSVAQAARMGRVRAEPGCRHWFNHVLFNPGGSRALLFHRWEHEAVSGHRGFHSRLFTLGADGSDPVCLIEGVGISHYDWLDDHTILIFLEEPGVGRGGYFLVSDPGGERRPVAPDHFELDGHCCLSPDRRWMVTDTYPQGPGREQPLFLYELATGRGVEVGRFHAAPVENTAWRCDLHTRWRPDGRALCFDSTHGGDRQMYVADVSAVVG